MELNQNQNAMDQLRQMSGMRKIVDQFQRYLQAYKDYRDGHLDHFRPHMVLMGNPGTGKTTVARLFGEILHEEGLLSQGQFVDATVGDLVGQYIGETRYKTQAVCDRAKGGVLFIDEAYGLMPIGGGTVDFGQEAIEVLIQFMNTPDSLVIFAGYPEEMKWFIAEGNPGLKRRFDKLGFFYFEDFEPDVLYKIVRGKISNSINTTEAFDKALYGICAHKYAYRSKFFGNARDMLNLASTIVSAYYDAGGAGDLDVSHIPDYLRVQVDPILPPSMERLEKMTGLENIKKQFERYCDAFKRYRDGKVPGNFHQHMAFMGNPGTGKTTVARLFAEILHEDGLLPQGHIVEVSPLDLISEYVGQTRPKTQSVCDKAKGGVLFIDEAYELMRDFGQEAIEVLIKFMMNNDDTVVIFVGYSDEMEKFMYVTRIKAHFLQENNIYYFDDYKPDSLFNILVDKLNGYEMTEECKSEMLQIIRYQYEHRDEKSWGNARTMENYANEILGIFFSKHHGDGIIDVDCIPEHIRIPEVSKKQLKEELMLIVNEIQEKLQQLQSKLNELSEE